VLATFAIIAGAVPVQTLRWGYSRPIPWATNQFPDRVKFTMICVSTSTGSPLRM
jgi:hypothetical protein